MKVIITYDHIDKRNKCVYNDLRSISICDSQTALQLLLASFDRGSDIVKSVKIDGQELIQN